jgi:hypothetical protein
VEHVASIFRVKEKAKKGASIFRVKEKAKKGSIIKQLPNSAWLIPRL